MNGYPTIKIDVEISRTANNMDYHYKGELHVLYEEDKITERSREMTNENLVVMPDKDNVIWDDVPTGPQSDWFKEEIDNISTWEYENSYFNEKDLIV